MLKPQPLKLIESALQYNLQIAVGCVAMVMLKTKAYNHDISKSKVNARSVRSVPRGVLQGSPFLSLQPRLCASPSTLGTYRDLSQLYVVEWGCMQHVQAELMERLHGSADSHDKDVAPLLVSPQGTDTQAHWYHTYLELEVFSEVGDCIASAAGQLL